MPTHKPPQNVKFAMKSMAKWPLFHQVSAEGKMAHFGGPAPQISEFHIFGAKSWVLQLDLSKFTSEP
jgi:hypothetical protein